MIKEKIISGTNFRLLAINSDRKTIDETSNYFGDESNILQSRLEANLSNLYIKIVKEYPRQIKIKVISHRPAMGYFILDPHKEYGYMRVEPYICKSDRHERPMFQLTNEVNKEWFDIYCEDYKNLWEQAKEWKPPGTNH